MRSSLGASFTGSSNTYLAYKHDLEAIGTNAHELPMALAALANTDAELYHAQYRVLELWQQSYGGELLVMLPDTFGTTQFLAGAPAFVANWTGQRCDSKDPFIASDGLDVDEILKLHAYFHDRIRFSAGWGTLLTNDFRECDPRGIDSLRPISLVCKIKTVEGRPAVKLSDNLRKATGPEEEIARYRRVFGSEATVGPEILV
jgi:nicotinate phosphoribosyltransferase